jgi:mannose-1-phosphate guanylyltransferase/phosphomannomutase
MVPVANRPLMAYTIELLARHGLRDITVLLYHRPKIIKDYFQDGSHFGVKINYVEATEDYGTAGAVRNACGDAKEPSLVISADLITDIDLSAAVSFHKHKKAFATMVLTRVTNPLPYGIVITDKKGKIKKFLEKPAWSEVFSDTINTGIYILEPGALRSIPAKQSFDFGHDLFPKLLQDKRALYGYTAAGYWEDIGRLEDYGRCQMDVLSGRVSIKGAPAVGEKTEVEKGAECVSSVIGNNCFIGGGSYMRECVIWDGVGIGRGARLEKSYVGRNVKIGEGAILEEGAVVGDGSKIGKGAVIKSFVKLWPGKVVEEGAVVSGTNVWRERWSRSIFGPYGVTGHCNIDLNPQFLAALGAAYGSVLGKGARISCSRDSHKASRMLYRGLISGVLSTGVNISNLETVPIPVNRFEIRSLKSQGGFHVRMSPFDPDVIDIKFFDAHGMDLSSNSEKKIERTFAGENFTQASADEIGELSYPYHRVAEEYEAAMFSYLDMQALCAAGMKVVIDYAYGCATQIFPNILGELGLDVIALNAYIDETKITKDREAFFSSLGQMTKIVKSVGADFGIMFDTGGEKIFLCDDEGQVLSGHQTLAIMAIMALKSSRNKTIAVPMRESRMVEEIAKKYKGKVIRTKNSFRGMMEAAAGKGISFLGESQGGFIFPAFLPAFDAMLSTCKIVEFLAKEKIKLRELTAEIKPAAVLHREVNCSSEQKGEIMRRLSESKTGADKMEMVDGIKLWHGYDWILVLPDSLSPVMHLYAEADSDKKAQALIDRYIALMQR